MNFLLRLLLIGLQAGAGVCQQRSVAIAGYDPEIERIIRGAL